MNIVFLADAYAAQILGGGELNNDELIKILIEAGNTVECYNTYSVDEFFIKKNKEKKFIIANFIGLTELTKLAIQETEYIIYEHDHKYIPSRNPADYEDYVCTDIINYDFYKNAKRIFCQSDFHKEIVDKNLHLDNTDHLTVTCGLWNLSTKWKSYLKKKS